MNLLQNLGFTINYDKSSFTPNNQIQHLGFIIDTKKYTLGLPPQKVLKIKVACEILLAHKYVTIRQFSRVIGLLVSSFLAVKHAQLHTRYLEIY